MLTLLTFPGSFAEPSHSPFCVKAMCLLEMAGQLWARKDMSNPARMPYSRLPVLKTEARLIADSSFIQSYLEAEGADFDVSLSETDKARSHMLIRTVEENLRLSLVHDRWLDDCCWDKVRDIFFAEVPRPLRGPISRSVRKKVRAALTSHGTAQFTPADRNVRVERDLDAITAQLGDKAFLFGDTPTAADAATAPVLSMINGLPCDTALRRTVRERAPLLAYVDRTRQAIYPD